ncbi:MAG: hypothetical protein ACYTF1_26145 [Planctomycetota bacterium]|jgi:hypothetical protein
MPHAQVPFSQLVFSLDVLPRDKNLKVIKEYAEIIRMGPPDGTAMNGKDGPPVVFRDIAGKFWVADGSKRLWAQEVLGVDLPWVEVRTGTKAHAIWYAAGANREHGQRMSPAGIRAAVDNLLKHLTTQPPSIREIAVQVGCPASLVLARSSKLGGYREKRRPLEKKSKLPSLTPEQKRWRAIETILNDLGRWMDSVVDSGLLTKVEMESMRTPLDDLRAPLVKALTR